MYVFGRAPIHPFLERRRQSHLQLPYGSGQIRNCLADEDERSEAPPSPLRHSDSSWPLVPSHFICRGALRWQKDQYKLFSEGLRFEQLFRHLQRRLGISIEPACIYQSILDTHVPPLATSLCKASRSVSSPKTRQVFCAFRKAAAPLATEPDAIRCAHGVFCRVTTNRTVSWHKSNGRMLMQLA